MLQEGHFKAACRSSATPITLPASPEALMSELEGPADKISSKCAFSAPLEVTVAARKSMALSGCCSKAGACGGCYKGCEC